MHSQDSLAGTRRRYFSAILASDSGYPQPCKRHQRNSRYAARTTSPVRRHESIGGASPLYVGYVPLCLRQQPTKFTRPRTPPRLPDKRKRSRPIWDTQETCEDGQVQIPTGQSAAADSSYANSQRFALVQEDFPVDARKSVWTKKLCGGYTLEESELPR